MRDFIHYLLSKYFLIGHYEVSRLYVNLFRFDICQYGNLIRRKVFLLAQISEIQYKFAFFYFFIFSIRLICNISLNFWVDLFKNRLAR
ncbi:Uncharacterized protein PRO82_000701 [Candidatus Protochlamydia amoebophila]|nr:Uncharacterized protein [Candidatus Protochlamydia amoebophila]